MYIAMFLIQAAATAVNPSPSLEQLQQQVRDAYSTVETEQKKKPPAANVSEQLIRLGERDQAGRSAWQEIDFNNIPEPQRTEWKGAVFEEISRYDQIHQAELKRLIPADGWFKISVYGEEAAYSAFLIVQHAVNDQDFMRSVLKKLGELSREGEAEGQLYGMMYDRVALEFDHKQQLYGTQVRCDGGRWQAYDLKEPDDVDERRKSIGMIQTLEQYLSMFDNAECPHS